MGHHRALLRRDNTHPKVMTSGDRRVTDFLAHMPTNKPTARNMGHRRKLQYALVGYDVLIVFA